MPPEGRNVDSVEMWMVMFPPLVLLGAESNLRTICTPLTHSTSPAVGTTKSRAVRNDDIRSTEPNKRRSANLWD